jgi:iron complex outermembrane recepter protein
MNKRLMGSAVSLLALISTPAFAQALPPTGSAGSESSAVPTVEDIIVTGSRTIKNGDSAPTPVTVVSTAALAATTPSNIPDALNKLPVFSNSSSPQTLGNGGSNSSGNVLNLRGLGGIRTLILLDGHRVASTNADGTVDVDTLPQMLMKRVDVVTGGTSAVYGSDAITGVVNFILDTKLNGLRLEGQTGIASAGDDQSWKIGVAGGTDLFGGRGHIEASFQHYYSAGIPDKSARPIGAGVYSETGLGTVASPFILSGNTRTTIASFGGLINSGPLAGMEFSRNGILSSFVNGAATGSGGIQSGGNGAYFSNNSLAASLQTDQAFSRFDFELSNATHFYTQASWTRARNQSNFAPSLFLFDTISTSNAFLSPAIQAAASAGGNSTFLFSRFFGNAQGVTDQFTVKTINISTGIDGKVGRFNWDVNYSHSNSQTLGVTLNNLNNGRLAAALDAVSSNGQIVCRVSVTNPGLYPGCIPLNPFGPTAQSQAALDYVRGTTEYTLTNKMDDVSATINGDLLTLPAGPMTVALSGDFRHIALTNFSSAQPTDTISCTGLGYNCTPSGTAPWFLNVVANMQAGENIGEGAIEVNAPLLKNVPLIEELNINGAARYSQYSVSGNATTWKVGLDWHVAGGLRVRATRSRDFRAPTLYDLFAPVNASVVGFSDPLTNQSGTVTSESTGNSALKPEVGTTTTAGIVYRPEWARRFSIALDYYKISISNAIQTVGASDQTEALCLASGGVSPLCGLTVRPGAYNDASASNYPTLLLSEALNISNEWTHGVDIETNYGFSLGHGSVDLRGLISYQPELKSQLLPSTPIVNSAGSADSTGVPKWRLNFQGEYRSGPLTIDVAERWRSSLVQSGDQQLVYATPPVNSIGYTDLTLRMKIPTAQRSMEAFVSVQNLFNAKPPIYASTALASVPGLFVPSVAGDDIVGTYITVGVKLRL